MKVVRGNFNNEEPANDDASAMFNALVAPLTSKLTEFDDVEYICEIGVVSWNMGSYKISGLPNFDTMFSSTISATGIDQKGRDLVQMLMRNRIESFPETTHFIKEYDLEQNEDQSFDITVTGQSLAEFMLDEDEEDEDEIEVDELDEFDADEEELQNQEAYIDRYAVTLTHQPAFHAFLKGKDADLQLDEDEADIYLIPELDTSELVDAWIDENYRRMLNAELEVFTDDFEEWSADVSLEQFKQFFNISFTSMVRDLVEAPVRKV
jgi:hypothetical protein